jgi:hypothetical protein
MPFGNQHLVVAVACVMLVPTIYVFRLHKALLLEGRAATGTAVALGFLGLVGVAEAARHGFERRSMAITAALALPFVHRFIFLGAYRWFVRKVGREPVDVTYNSAPGLAADRAFAIVLPLVFMFGGMALISYFAYGSRFR